MRAWIYDRLFNHLSSGWYRAVIEQLPEGAKVLDVGVGTGASLLDQLELVRSKGLAWHGIDINTAYLQACQERIDRLDAGDCIQVREQSVYDVKEEALLDAVYFSASFMLLPDQKSALEACLGSLKPDGVICFTQTFETKRAPLMEWIKPLLKRLTTVDFGVVTYLDSMTDLLSSVGLTVRHNEVIGTQGPREMRVIIAERATKEEVEAS